MVHVGTMWYSYSIWLYIDYYKHLNKKLNFLLSAKFQSFKFPGTFCMSTFLCKYMLKVILLLFYFIFYFFAQYFVPFIHL